jgi:hypothetical protein
VTKPSQAKVVTDIPLSAIPALAASLGLLTDTLTLTGGYAFANYMKSGWKASTELTKTSAWKALHLIGEE